MALEKLGRGLGWFSIALGVGELVAGRRIGRMLGVEQRSGVIRGFGLREIAAGVGLLTAPRHPARMWNRVGGDALDIAALGAAARNNPKRKAVFGALAFVLGATVVDILVASAMSAKPDSEPGRIGPGSATPLAA